jgi:hypothetical protein
MSPARSWWWCCVATAALSATSASTARATEPEALDPPSPVISTSPADPDPRRPLSIMVSPILFLAPIGQITVEAPLTRHLAIAALAGVGRIAVRSTTLTTHLDVSSLGAQIQYALVGDFRQALQVGLEALYIRLQSPFMQQDPIEVDAVESGPFVGYKRVWRVGFTVEAQVGYEMTWARVQAGDPESPATHVAESGLLLNLNAGWTFR